MAKNLVVAPYDPLWPNIFQLKAEAIKTDLSDNCIAIHHVGSTSVPGLPAKPIIDMILVVKDQERTILPLETLGYKYKGEYNLPMRYYFNCADANLHVYEENHPEIELNLLFRDYLRSHPEVRDEYAKLKEDLLKDPSSFVKKNYMFTGYNLGKDAFIRKVLKESGFSRLRITRCAHYVEWESAKKFTQTELPLGEDHIHLMLYKGIEIVGYAHVQLLENQSPQITLLIEESYKDQGFEIQYLAFCENWLRRLPS